LALFSNLLLVSSTVRKSTYRIPLLLMSYLLSLKLVSEGRIKPKSEPILSGIPFSKGRLFEVDRLHLLDSTGEAISAYFYPISRWPDGSVKWLHLYFQLSLEVANSDELFIGYSNDQSPDNFTQFQSREILVETTDENISVNTGKAVFVVPKSNVGPFSQIFVNQNKQLAGCGSRLMMKDSTGDELKTQVTSIDYGDTTNPLQRTLTIEGDFLDSYEERFVEFTFRITFYASLATVKLDFSVLNSRAAEHPKGVWDLGDRGSVLFSDLAAEFSLPVNKEDMSLNVKHCSDHEWKSISSRDYCLYQDSSGGVNWNSSNHVNASGDVPVNFPGYKYFEYGTEAGKGLRANPRIRLSSVSGNVSAYIEEFWQYFPKAIEVEQNKLRLKLFPDQFADDFELQGGEQKTHTFFLDFSDDTEALNWCVSPRLVQIESGYLASTKAVHLLPAVYHEDGLQKLINRGIVGAHNFFEKREIIDEFGWRNYGEIYADHEELNYQGSVHLVSHYNNQYDVLDGFLRQFIVSGNRRWFDLAGPLARHIVDIDIYHTTEDKDEYNGGLFWHTDHYSNAYTCTHRTYSIKNSTSYDGEVGGGPGMEHCYTAGLANFYFLTGDPVYKDAALGLVQWIKRSFEGSGTVLESIFKFFTRDISIIRQLVSGRVVQKYKYPFTRATGNYLSSLLDAYQLTDDPDYIERAEKVIKQSIHPTDDISLRRLDDIELRWSYLIFLQAICKYLVIKSANAETDNAYCYARDSLLHYANWIMVNERPFLENSDQLDFPNLTWVAQDLRKAYVLRIASCFRTQNQDGMRSAAKFFSEYVTQQLKGADTSHYTRILVILMQNYLPDDSVIADSIDCHIDPYNPIDYGQALDHRLGTVLLDFVTDLFKCLRYFSLSSEIRWLKFRIKIF